jgi:ethanolamine ammonia-lyase small subunit
VHAPLDAAKLQAELATLGLPVLIVASAVPDRAQYLMRPDLGRRLAAGADDVLAASAGRDHDLALVVTDGLSARAVETHARPVLAELLPALRTAGWRIAPLVIVRQGRVATADRVAQALRAGCVVNLIGERPGLSAPDSMGAYLTFAPKVGLTDADRNCVSNIHQEGLLYDEAAFKIAWLVREALARRVTGVALKDESGDGTSRHIAGKSPPV